MASVQTVTNTSECVTAKNQFKTFFLDCLDGVLFDKETLLSKLKDWGFGKNQIKTLLGQVDTLVGENTTEALTYRCTMSNHDHAGTIYFQQIKSKELPHPLRGRISLTLKNCCTQFVRVNSAQIELPVNGLYIVHPLDIEEKKSLN